MPNVFDILNLATQGVNGSDICSQLGISADDVRSMISEFGLQRCRNQYGIDVDNLLSQLG